MISSLENIGKELVMGFRFIHAADLHLDTPFKGLQQLPAPIRDRITRSTFVSFENLVELALAEQVDFVLFAGDIYDTSARSLQAQLQFKQGLEKLSRAGISSFIVHGNHDPLDGEHIPIEWPKLVHFFSADGVQRIPFYKQGREVASIYGFSYPTAHFTTNISKEFKRESDAFAIGLLHTNCDHITNHSNYAPSSKQDLLQAGFDYWALGHVHQRKLVHEQPPIVYPGNLQGRHRLELGEKGCYIVDVSHQGRIEQLNFVPLQDVLWLEETIDISRCKLFQEVLDCIEEAVTKLREQYKSALILYIKLTGQTELWQELSQTDVLTDITQMWQQEEKNKEHFVWLASIQFAGGMNIDRDSLLAGEGLYADLIKLVDDLLVSPTQLDLLEEKPLASLFNHSRAKRLLAPLSLEEKKELLEQAEKLILADLLGRETK